MNDGKPFSKVTVVGFCHYHKTPLTPNIIKTHGCLKKNGGAHCTRMQKYDCDYWHKRATRKQRAKDERNKRFAELESKRWKKKTTQTSQDWKKRTGN